MKQRLTLRPVRRDATADTAAWPVLVVDDEPDIYDMTRILLRDLAFQGRAFELISAYSAGQVLAQRPDIPVALLAAADDALCRAKREGRDRVAVAE
ncbi:MAG: hypothetical protein HYU60_00935 [Magnetospirillum sp.]|nr:hypothetical protein [Magnetospirillum sp.]